jgi:hypothetical protein
LGGGTTDGTIGGGSAIGGTGFEIFQAAASGVNPVLPEVGFGGTGGGRCLPDECEDLEILESVRAYCNNDRAGKGT